MKSGARSAALVAVLGLGIAVVLLMSSSLAAAAIGEVDLAIALEAPAHVAAGSTFQVRIVYYNQGTAPAPDAAVTATLPDETQFLAATDRWGAPLPPDVATDNTLIWNFEGLESCRALDACRDHIVLTLQTDAGVPEGTELATAASVATTAAESDTTDNEASAVSLVCAMAGSAKQVQAGFAMPGDVLTYTITINRAPQPGMNNWEWVTLTDTLPFSHQVRFLGWTGTVTGTVHDGQVLRWEGRVQAGEPVQLQYRLGVEGAVTPGTTISNTAMLRWREREMQLGPVTTVITLPHGALALGPNQYGEVHHRYGVTLTVPPGAVTDTTRFQIGPLFTETRPTDPPAGLVFANRAFEMNAFRFGHQVREFNQPLTITLAFSGSDAPGVKRETLRLWTRSGPGEPWAMLGEPVRTMSGTLSFTATHFSQFALFGRGQYQTYLPLLRR
jgi:uncharacterized repeat protein (TIGR01451 family)